MHKVIVNLFARKWRNMLEEHPMIDFGKIMGSGILVQDGRVGGVRTSMGLEIESKAVVTNGTFLNGIIHGRKKQWRRSRR